MASIGIFDSGSGGLSVYRELRKILPRERYLYFSDNAHCPYGEKSAAYIQDRARVITDILLGMGGDIIVVACNTATAAAIATLREEYPAVPFIGMEPAVKPAALGTESGVIGVLATAGTLKGSKYLNTRGQYEDDVKIVEHVGQGFVELVQSWKDLVAAGETPLPLLAERIVNDIAYKEFLRKDDELSADERIGNVDEMINAIREFDEEHPGATLDAFLQDISLLTDGDKKVDESKGQVTLMTIHMAKGLEFHTRFEPGAYVMGDYTALYSLAQNLIENAIKYTNAPGEITISVYTEEDRAVFSVTDTGVGIDSSEQKNIFNDFYRVGDEMTRSTKGSGLGLAIVKRVAETHKATISLSSKLGKGSTFTVRFKKVD